MSCFSEFVCGVLDSGTGSVDYGSLQQFVAEVRRPVTVVDSAAQTTALYGQVNTFSLTVSCRTHLSATVLEVLEQNLSHSSLFLFRKLWSWLRVGRSSLCPWFWRRRHVSTPKRRRRCLRDTKKVQYSTQCSGKCHTRGIKTKNYILND